MKSSFWVAMILAGASAGLAGAAVAQTSGNMSFFITSVGKGDGANLGGLAGADAHCAALAKAAGSFRKAVHWRFRTARSREIVPSITGEASVPRAVR